MSIQTSLGDKPGLRAWSVRLAVLVTVGAISATAGALELGSLPPELEATDVAGHPVTMAGFRGKVVLVDFWASWCASGRAQLPVLEALYRKYRSAGFEVIAVNEDRHADRARSFLRRVTFAVVHDSHAAIAKRYAPSKMPSSYLIDRTGILRYLHSGFGSRDAATLETEIKRLLGNT